MVQAAEQRLCQLFRFRAALHARQQGKLIASESRQNVVAALVGMKPACHLLEKSVTGRMTPGVVDYLEAIEVEQQQCRPWLAAAILAELGPEAFDEETPVWQAGQFVVVDEVRDLAGTPTGDADAEHAGETEENLTKDWDRREH